MLGAEILGLYWVAFRWAQLPINGFTFVASRVAYPVYARLRNEPGRFADGYLRVLQTIVTLAMPASVGLALVADALVRTLTRAGRPPSPRSASSRATASSRPWRRRRARCSKAPGCRAG